MRRVGLILLAAGLGGFLFASAQRTRLESPGTIADTPPSAQERRALEGWETARWLLLGMGVMGLVFTVLPGKKT